MERKLASVQRVLDVVPIENADAIELVKINGWQCVVKKNEFQPGDLGVYLEIDAIPPDWDVFRFLWTPKPKRDEAGNLMPVSPEALVRPAKFRIRTLRLRGTLSQGLFLPLQAFPEMNSVQNGDDVTGVLQVGKYEQPPPTGMGDWRAPFPAFVPKTDEMRVQSVPGVLSELRGLPYVVTLKYDGTSSTFAIDPRTNEFHACGRNQSVNDGPNVYWNMARKYHMEAVLRRSPHLVVQGEIVGPGIQKNPLGLKEVGWFAFNVYDISSGNYLSHDDARAFLADNRLPVVETIERGDAFAHTQESLLTLAEGKYAGTNNEREGVVIRSQTEMRSEVLGGRLSFKAISNRFLLKETD